MDDVRIVMIQVVTTAWHLGSLTDDKYLTIEQELEITDQQVLEVTDDDGYPIHDWRHDDE